MLSGSPSAFLNTANAADQTWRKGSHFPLWQDAWDRRVVRSCLGDCHVVDEFTDPRWHRAEHGLRYRYRVSPYRRPSQHRPGLVTPE